MLLDDEVLPVFLEYFDLLRTYNSPAFELELYKNSLC